MKHFSQKRTTVFYTDELETFIVHDFDKVSTAKAFYSSIPLKFDRGDYQSNLEILREFSEYLQEFLNKHKPQIVWLYRDIPTADGKRIDRTESYRGELETYNDTLAFAKVRVQGMTKDEIKRKRETGLHRTIDGATLLIHRETNYVIAVGTAVEMKWFAKEFAEWKHVGDGKFVSRCEKYTIQSRNAIGFTAEEAKKNRNNLRTLSRKHLFNCTY